jgi:hypothetical protein
LTLAGILVFVVITVGDPSYSAYAWAEILALLSVAGSLAARDSIQNAGGKAARQRAFAAILGVMVTGLAVILATRLVATGTIGATSASSARLTYLNFDMIVITLTVLFWVPQFFFHIKLDMQGTGDAQRVLLGLIAVAASALTAAYIVLLHLGGGPLRKVSIGPLVAGIVGLAVLITPLYRSLARACWSRGISGIVSFNEYQQDWYKMLKELRMAVDQALGGDTRPNTGDGTRQIRGPVAAKTTTPRPQAQISAIRSWPKRGLYTACALVALGSILLS